jgi:hypothetical protein
LPVMRKSARAASAYSRNLLSSGSGVTCRPRQPGRFGDREEQDGALEAAGFSAAEKTILVSILLCRERWTPGKLSTFLHVLNASRRRRHSVVPCTTACGVRTTFTSGLKAPDQYRPHSAPGTCRLTPSDPVFIPRCGDRHGPFTTAPNFLLLNPKYLHQCSAATLVSPCNSRIANQLRHDDRQLHPERRPNPPHLRAMLTERNNLPPIWLRLAESFFPGI